MRVPIEKGNLTALPFPGGAFDAAVSTNALDHLGRQTGLGLREIHRKLKPVERLPLIVWAPGCTTFAIGTFLPLFLAASREWCRMVKDAGFTIGIEGEFNSTWFALLSMPEAQMSAGPARLMGAVAATGTNLMMTGMINAEI